MLKIFKNKKINAVYRTIEPDYPPPPVFNKSICLECTIKYNHLNAHRATETAQISIITSKTYKRTTCAVK